VAGTATAGVRHTHETVTDDPQVCAGSGPKSSLSAAMQALRTGSVRRTLQAAVMDVALQLLAWAGVVVAASVAAAVGIGLLFG
jgi:hypothetical protein